MIADQKHMGKVEKEEPDFNALKFYSRIIFLRSGNSRLYNGGKANKNQREFW